MNELVLFESSDGLVTLDGLSRQVTTRCGISALGQFYTQAPQLRRMRGDGYWLVNTPLSILAILLFLLILFFLIFFAT